MRLRVWEKMVIAYAVMLSVVNTFLSVVGVRSFDSYISLDILVYFITTAVTPVPQRASKRMNVLSAVMFILFSILVARRIMIILRG